MSRTETGGRIAPASTDVVEMERAAGRSNGRRIPLVLPLPLDTRERLTAFYRQRDEVDAARYASGAQRARGAVWANGLRRLERGDKVYESYGVLSSAGIEVPAAAKTILAELPNDWRQICLIDGDGVVRAASVKQRMRSGR